MFFFLIFFIVLYDPHPRILETKAKINKWDLINCVLLILRNSLQKKPVKVQRKATMSEAIFAIHKSKTHAQHKELLCINKKANRKMSKRFEEELIEIQMTN